MKTLVTEIFEYSARINNARTPSDIAKYSVTELGELMEEIIISEGQSYKEPGKDGVVGEAIDVIACMVDLIHVARPGITEEEILKIARPKLEKWAEKAYRPKLVARREHGPHHDPDVGGTYGGRWVVRDTRNGAVIDIDQYRNDLLDRYEGLIVIDE